MSLGSDEHMEMEIALSVVTQLSEFVVTVSSTGLVCVAAGVTG